MKKLLLTGCLALVATAAQAAPVLINDFEGTVSNAGGGPNNSGLSVESGSGGVRGDFDFTPATATVVGGLGGSATAVNLVPGATSTYDGLVDFNTANLFAAVGLDPSTFDTGAGDQFLVSFDYDLNATTDAYNGIVGIANTDNTDGNNFNQGANGFYFGTGPASGSTTIDFSDLVALLDPAINPGYSSLRLLANKDAASTLDLTIDNVTAEFIPGAVAIPEPSALAALALVGGVVATRRRRR